MYASGRGVEVGKLMGACTLSVCVCVCVCRIKGKRETGRVTWCEGV